MPDRFRTYVWIFSSCTIVFMIFLSYSFSESPTAYSWHLLQAPVKLTKTVIGLQNGLLRNATYPKTEQKNIDFPKQDVQEVINSFDKLLEKYYADIINTASELKTQNPTWRDTGNGKKTISGYTPDYLDQVRDLPSVRTIMAEVDFSEFKDAFNMHYYHYGSSDCIQLENKGIYGKGWGKNAFNDTCVTDVSQYADPLPLYKNYLSIGLPNNFNLDQTVLTYIHIISNAVVTDIGDVYADQIILVPQRCSTKPKGRLSPSKTPVYDEVLTIAQFWGSGFFHFTSENLIRIGPYVELLRHNTNIKVHVVKRTGFIDTWLKLLGISSDRLVSGTIRATLLYMPAGGTCGRPAYFPSNMLSMQLRLSSGVTPAPRNTVVVIQRSSRRYFRNHNQIFKMVVDVAEPLGFEVKLFSDKHYPSMTETKEMFQRAVLVVGPHGAGLSNMFFTQPGTFILEGLCRPVNLCYRNLAKVLGHRYVGLMFNKNCFDVTPDDIRHYLEYFLQHIKTDKR